jgi:cellulose synthase/poly-beta-1,6-N-acetylglucosamine synthase-like glycosyltransferase
MAFQYDYFRKMMSTVDAVGGFDKEIELKMLKGRGKIAYLDDALIYDEKVQKAEVFHNQRRRWLSAQLHYFRKDFFSALKELALKGNIDYFDKVIQFIQPPRILLLGTLLISGIVFLLLNRIAGDNLYFQAAWISLMGMCISTLACSIPLSFYRPDTLKALKSLPSGMWLMFRSLLKIRGANNEFIHTRHGTENENV